MRPIVCGWPSAVPVTPVTVARAVSSVSRCAARLAVSTVRRPVASIRDLSFTEAAALYTFYLSPFLLWQASIVRNSFQLEKSFLKIWLNEIKALPLQPQTTNGALDEWLSQRSAKPSTAVRIRQAPRFYKSSAIMGTYSEKRVCPLFIKPLHAHKRKDTPWP